MQERIIQTIHQSIEIKMQIGEILAPAIEQTSQLMVSAILNEKKIMVAGNGNNSALGQIFVATGDVLLMVSTTGTASNLVQAIAAAHDRDMPVVALTGKDGGNIATLLDLNDIELRAPSDANTHIHETHLLCLLSICDLIDYQLFGAQ